MVQDGTNLRLVQAGWLGTRRPNFNKRGFLRAVFFAHVAHDCRVAKCNPGYRLQWCPERQGLRIIVFRVLRGLNELRKATPF